MSKEEIYRDFYETIKERVESGLPIWTEALLDCIKENEAALKEVEKEQPKLSIPKNIAEMLEEGDISYLSWTQSNDLLLVDGDEARKKREKEIIKRKAIASIYLASKALGVEFVEVEE
ncbi:hypothetical protein [Lactococcus petauri]|uniref:hypothetical protein n=1 Tax=Lactococcus petauri TaxID=1940789 RepID=UPI003853D042